MFFLYNSKNSLLKLGPINELHGAEYFMLEKFPVIPGPLIIVKLMAHPNKNELVIIIGSEETKIIEVDKEKRSLDIP